MFILMNSKHHETKFLVPSISQGFQTDMKQALHDITGQLQVRPMLYTLYFFYINLRVVKMLQTDNKQQITK